MIHGLLLVAVRLPLPPLYPLRSLPVYPWPEGQTQTGRRPFANCAAFLFLALLCCLLLAAVLIWPQKLKLPSDNHNHDLAPTHSMLLTIDPWVLVACL